jgi:hypothetical protein
VNVIRSSRVEMMVKKKRGTEEARDGHLTLSMTRLWTDGANGEVERKI